MNIKIKSIFILTLFPLLVNGNTELPDPTRPATYISDNVEPIYIEEFNVKQKKIWILSAIRISKKDKTAIVNGQLVRVGDEVGEATVLEIKPLSVIIGHEDNKLIVRLFKNLVNKDYKSAQ